MPLKFETTGIALPNFYKGLHPAVLFKRNDKLYLVGFWTITNLPNGGTFISTQQYERLYLIEAPENPELYRENEISVCDTRFLVAGNGNAFAICDSKLHEITDSGSKAIYKFDEKLSSLSYDYYDNKIVAISNTDNGANVYVFEQSGSVKNYKIPYKLFDFSSDSEHYYATCMGEDKLFVFSKDFSLVYEKDLGKYFKDAEFLGGKKLINIGVNDHFVTLVAGISSKGFKLLILNKQLKLKGEIWQGCMDTIPTRNYIFMSRCGFSPYKNVVFFIDPSGTIYMFPTDWLSKLISMRLILTGLSTRHDSGTAGTIGVDANLYFSDTIALYSSGYGVVGTLRLFETQEEPPSKKSGEGLFERLKRLFKL
jgi:hypothetical protein